MSKLTPERKRAMVEYSKRWRAEMPVIKMKRVKAKDRERKLVKGLSLRAMDKIALQDPDIAQGR